ncbi:MAG: hypothetical protein AAFQ41_14765 [Cyanobacteria bacterium J06623_7]
MVFTLERESDVAQTDNLNDLDNLIKYLTALMPDEQESNVNSHFIAPCFIGALGFSLAERVSEFKTKNSNSGQTRVDYALRKNTEGKIFAQDKVNPLVLMEIKGRDIDLTYGTKSYKKTVEQMKGYLLGSKCIAIEV